MDSMSTVRDARGASTVKSKQPELTVAFRNYLSSIFLQKIT
jgi:hypothetical protein